MINTIRNINIQKKIVTRHVSRQGAGREGVRQRWQSGDSLELDDGADLERLPGVRHKYGDSGGQTTFKLQYFVKLSVPKSPG